MNHKVEITKLQQLMLEMMPQDVAISVILTLAANMIRMKNGALIGDFLPDDPMVLIADIAKLVTITTLHEEAKAEKAEEMMIEVINKARTK